MRRTKIGFYLLGDPTWQAGTVYLTKLLHALRETQANDAALCLLVPDGGGAAPDELRELADEVIVYPTFPRKTARWAVDRMTKAMFRRDLIGGDLLLKQRGVEVVAFGNPYRSNIPRLCLLPDFQHLHAPEMFSAEEREARNRGWRMVAEEAARVIVFSESVRRDLEAFAPGCAAKARVVSPVSWIRESAYETDPKTVLDLYHLPDKFVYLPNQFWKHKNHGLAFRALGWLREKGTEVALVCTGYPGDYRHPEYFAELFHDVSRWGVRDQVAFLGVVPREHMFMLMRQSVCVLNPSLFEGYGMSVDEARSLGKQVLLSDISAHREQDPPGAVFFDPRDHEDLARKLEHLWRDKSPGPDRELEFEARQSLPQRVRACAASFMSMVREVAPS